LIRILAPALAMGGVALVLVNLMMGAGRSGWAWSTAVASTVGTTAVFALAATPHDAAVAMLVLQGTLLAVAVLHARRLFQAERDRGGEVLFLNWRDTRHPQGGGSEVYVEEIAGRLAAAGRRVTIFCAEHENAPREETRGGARLVRRGAWRTVCAGAAVDQLPGRLGPHGVVAGAESAAHA